MCHKMERFAGLCALIILIPTQATAQVPCEYEVTIIQAPTDCGIFGTVITVGLGINENGAVVGRYQCPLWEHSEAFVWTAKDGFITLDRPQGISSAVAVDINDNGVICGTVFVSGLDNRGFVYENGVWTILPPVVDVPGARSSTNAINNAGEVVGQRSLTEELNPLNAFIWSAAKGFRDLEGLEKLSAATAISGELITGWTANSGEMKEGFLWDNGKITLLGYIPGGFTSTPGGVNSIGVICGSGRVQNDPDGPISVLGFVWDDGVFTLIDPIIGYDTSGSGCINDGGQVTGLSVKLDQPTDRHGYVWIDGVTRDLNDLIIGESGVIIETTAGISDKGEIIANGDDGNGEIVAFLLTPRNAPLGDLDGDCRVSTIDLLLLFSAWVAQDLSADLNDDGIVNHLDLQLLFDNWG